MPSVFAAVATASCWMGTGRGARKVLLCARPRTGLARALRRTRPTLVLVPSARHLTPPLRERHAPGPRVELEALEEPSSCSAGGRSDAGDRSRTRRGRAAARADRGSLAARTAPRRSRSRCRCEASRSPRTEVPVRLLDARRCGSTRRALHPVHAIDFGMAHARTRKPARSVGGRRGGLRARRGYCRTSRLGDAGATTKLIHRVSGHLQELFGVEWLPCHRYRSDCGWRSRFEARLADPPEHLALSDICAPDRSKKSTGVIRSVLRVVIPLISG